MQWERLSEQIVGDEEAYYLQATKTTIQWSAFCLVSTTVWSIPAISTSSGRHSGMILYHQCCHHIQIKTTCSLKAHQHNNYIIESQSIQKPAHVRVIAFCWKRCELNMFWYHTADVLCTAAHWHGKKHFQIQNVLQFKGTLWYECHDQMGNLVKCPAGVSGPFFLDIECHIPRISVFHATCPGLDVQFWRLKILNPQTAKDSAEWRDVAEAIGIGSEHAYILQQDSLEPFGSKTPCNYGHSLPIFCLFPNAPWRLAAVCTSWPFGWFPLLPRRPLPRTGTVTAYVSLTLATADLSWLFWLSLPNQCVFQCGILESSKLSKSTQLRSWSLLS